MQDLEEIDAEKLRRRLARMGQEGDAGPKHNTMFANPSSLTRGDMNSPRGAPSELEGGKYYSRGLRWTTTGKLLSDVAAARVEAEKERQQKLDEKAEERERRLQQRAEEELAVTRQELEEAVAAAGKEKIQVQHEMGRLLITVGAVAPHYTRAPPSPVAQTFTHFDFSLWRAAAVQGGRGTVEEPKGAARRGARRSGKGADAAA